MTVVIALVLLFLYAEEEYDAQAGAFLRLPVGARPAGLGDTFVAIADDANAVFWNPGGMYQIEVITVGGMYNIMSMDRHHYKGSIIYPYSKVSTFALMWNCFGVSNIDGRDENGNPTETFSDNEMSITMGYCYKLPTDIGLGANFKYLMHTLQDNQATGIGFDIGIHKKISDFSLGSSISNLGANLKWDTNSCLEEEIPTTIRAGVAYIVRFGKIPVLLSAEISKNAEESVVIHCGSEVTLLKLLQLRAGLNKEDINFGLSVKVSNISVDYAIVSDFLDDGVTSKIGLQIGF